MDTAAFLRRILPPAGDAYYCWCTPAPANDPKGRRYIQRFVKHVAQIVDGVTQCDEHQLNTYYAMASFTEKFSRKQDNVAALKAFWIDVDCGEAKAAEGKGYATKKEGATRLLSAVQSAGLPLPMVVDSGNGLHAYWPLVEAVPAEVWRPVAARIVAALQGEGLIADWGCSTDHSRILRPVGTHNWKDKANPKPVRLRLDCPDYALQQIAEPVEHIIVALPASRNNDLGVNSDLGLPPEPPSSLPEIVAERCAQVAMFRDTNGCLPEPQWRAGLSILKSCVDGEAAAHTWSSGYPLYRFEETQEKLDQIKGPYTCATFERYNPAGCKDCLHKGKITSPIQLGRPEAEDPEDVEDEVEQVENPSTGVMVERIVTKQGDDGLTTYPSALQKSGIKWNGEAITLRMTVDDGGEKRKMDVPITHGYLYCHEIMRVEGVYQMRFEIQKRRGQSTEFINVPCASIAEPTAMRKAFYQHGISPIVGKEKEFETVIKTWFMHAQQHALETRTHTHFGWQRTGGFLVGTKLFRANVPVQEVALGGNALSQASMFKQQGDLETWKRLVAEAYGGKGQEQYQFILACSFGAPLMRLTQVEGVTVDMVSAESGVGKTTVAKASLSVWGDPDQMAQTYGHGATETAIFNRIATMNSLPCYLDEVTRAPAEFLGRLSYAVTSGKPRERAAQTGAAKELEEGWSTILLASGNTSMQGKIGASRGAADAEMGRVLEFRMDPAKLNADVTESRERFMSLAREHGTAGEIYAQYLVDNVDSIQRDLDRLTSHIEKRAKITAMERFWSAGAAAAIVGVKIAVHLGLVDFDVKRLLDWTIDRIIESRIAVASSSRTVADDFGNMVNAMAGAYIITDTRNPPHENQDLGFLGNRNVPQKIAGRIIKDENTLWLSIDAAKKWCADNNADYGAIVKAAKQSGKVKDEEKFNLGLNTIAPHTFVRCLVIDQSEGSAPQDD